MFFSFSSCSAGIPLGKQEVNCSLPKCKCYFQQVMMSTLKEENNTKKEDIGMSISSGVSLMGEDSQELMKSVELKATLREMEAMKESIKELREMNKVLMDQLKKNNESNINSGPPSFRRTESFPNSTAGSTSTIKVSRLKGKSSKDFEVPIEKFDGTELYPGLGGNFREWGENFVMELVTVQENMGWEWTENMKIQALGRSLTGAPLSFFRQNLSKWKSENKGTLDNIMGEMDMLYSKRITVQRGMELMRKPKEQDRSWSEHLVYLWAINKSMGGGQESAVLQALVNSAKPSLSNILNTVYNKYRQDYQMHALEIVDRAEDAEAIQAIKKEKVNMVRERRCYNCGKLGHIARDCRRTVNNVEESEDMEYVFNIFEEEDDEETEEGSIKWVLDSGSSLHFVSDRRVLVDIERVNKTGIGFENSEVNIQTAGKILLESEGRAKVQVNNVNYHPSVTKNLLSIGRLEEKGCVLKWFGKQRFLVNESTGEKLFEVYRKRGIWTITTKLWKGSNRTNGQVFSTTEDDGPSMKGTLMQVHHMLGHLSVEKILKLAKDPRQGIELTDEKIRTCIACAQGKQTKNAQPQKDSGRSGPTDRIGGVINADCKGPMTPVDRYGNRYFSLFIDHLTNVMRVFLSKTKSHAADKFGHFMAWFERKFDCKLHVLRTDGGQEFRAVDLLCERVGIERQTAEPYNQASNGKAERAIRTVMDLGRSILFASGLPTDFWGDAVMYACYILNRVPSRANAGSKSPLEAATGKIQNIGDLVPFGAECTVLVSQKYGRGAPKQPWAERATKGVIIGRSEEVKGYRIWLPKKNEVINSNHVQNITCYSEEQNKILKKVLLRDEDESEEKTSEGEEINERENDRTTEGENITKTFEPRKPNEDDVEIVKKSQLASNKKRESQVQEKGVTTRSKTGITKRKEVVNLIQHKDPRNYREAKNSPEWAQWALSMKEELDALIKLGTFTLMVRKNDMNTIHCKWVYKTKTTADGNIERFKSRIVACGNEQIEGESFNLKFAPTLGISTVMLILNVAIYYDQPARNGDVPNAYPRADTEEEFDIYIELPQGFEVSEETMECIGAKNRNEMVLKLNKNLYGLKQAGRLWNKHMDKFLKDHGYLQCVTDKCVYYRIEDNEIVIVALYVDDVLVTGSSKSAIDGFFETAKEMDIKDLGEVSKFLGMRFKWVENGYEVDQEQTIEDLLSKQGMENANPTRLPIQGTYDEIEEGKLLPSDPNNEQPVSVKVYQSIVGSLLWIARCTRPDILFAVQVATRKNHAPSEGDLRIVKQILRYLRGTSSLKMHLNGFKNCGDQVIVSGYSDADWGDNKSTRRSISGGIVLMNGSPTSWICKKQPCISLSTQEAEYIAGTEVVKEILGTTQLLQELKIPVKWPTLLWMDNTQAIQQIEQETTSMKLKHVDMRYKLSI